MLTATAQAATSVRLKASLRPDVLGGETTVVFDFRITGSAGHVPSPLTRVDLSYPAHLGLALSGFGFAACSQRRLEEDGPSGCPHESLMGYGTATAEIPIGPLIVDESAHITIFRAPAEEGAIGLLFSAEASAPVFAELVFPGLLLPAEQPFGGHIIINVPIVPALPGGPNVAVTQLHSIIGPKSIVYDERVGDRTIHYRPKGVAVPTSCPRGGFPFAASFSFEDGTRAASRTAAPCPSMRAHAR